MSDTYDPQNADLTDALRLTGVETPAPAEEDNAPLYRIVGNTKIAVSKAAGKLWQSRVDQAKSARQDIEKCWSEAIRYYENDQLDHRDANKRNSSGNGRYVRRKMSEQWTETENVVFANATAMLPLLYAKNPSVEITATNQDVNADFALCCEQLINKLFYMKDGPGLNFKSKARRAVLAAYLMNTSYLQLGWCDKQDSSEAAIAELQELSQALADADDQGDIKEIEGQIQALEEKISFLQPAGPSVVLRSPFRVFSDPTGLEPDHSDAQWMAYYDFIPTTYLRAVYGKKQGSDEDGDSDNADYVSVYEPTHVLKAGADLNSLDDELNSFSLIKDGASSQNAKAYGYNNDEAYRAAEHTKVWYVWDKTTRRVYLFMDNDWKWPLWVWDDPLKLLRFYPFYRLWFHETPEGSQPKGEVTYYLDQQDAINDINSTIHRARTWARLNVYFDKNKVSQDDVEAVLKGPDGTARGVDVPEGGKLDDVIKSFTVPAMSHPELLSIDTKLQSINRMTGISDAMRGAQFKTNTTNQAVNAYQQTIEGRVDEKVDAIEDWIGDFAWGLIQLCCRYWSTQEVAAIVGDQIAQAWKQVQDPNELRTLLNLQVVGGSTEKPTSKAKKQEAMQLSQAMGQFANSSPAVVVVMLKMLERAFNNEVVITETDWKMIIDTMQQNLQKAGAGPGGQQQGQPQPQPQPGQPPQGGAQPTPEEASQLQHMIQTMPPKLKQQLQVLVQHGMPPMQALSAVMHLKEPPAQPQQQQQPNPSQQPPQ